MVVRVDETALRAFKKGASNRIQYRIPRDHCGVVERERERERPRERPNLNSNPLNLHIGRF